MNLKQLSQLSLFGLAEEREYLIESLAILFASRQNIMSALDAVKAEAKSARMKALIEEIRKDVAGGLGISAALARTKLIPEHYLVLLRIGEQTGKLSENFTLLSAQRAKERDFRAKVRSAMMYPVLVLSITLGVGIGIAWFILPRLTTVFSQLRIELPLITRWLIATGKFLNAYGTVVVPIFLVVLAEIFYLLFINKRTRFVGEAFLFAIPPVRRLLQQTEISRVGYLLGTLLYAGIPIREAIASLAGSSSLRVYRDFYRYLGQSLADGNSFRKSFAAYPHSERLFPFTVQQMISAAEESGRLSETLKETGAIYESKVDITTKNLSVMLEPLLLVIVWLGVVGVALAIILPIYSLVGGLNH